MGLREPNPSLHDMVEYSSQSRSVLLGNATPLPLSCCRRRREWGKRWVYAGNAKTGSAKCCKIPIPLPGESMALWYIYVRKSHWMVQMVEAPQVAYITRMSFSVFLLQSSQRWNWADAGFTPRLGGGWGCNQNGSDERDDDLFSTYGTAAMLIYAKNRKMDECSLAATEDHEPHLTKKWISLGCMEFGSTQHPVRVGGVWWTSTRRHDMPLTPTTYCCAQPTFFAGELPGALPAASREMRWVHQETQHIRERARVAGGRHVNVCTRHGVHPYRKAPARKTIKLG